MGVRRLADVFLASHILRTWWCWWYFLKLVQYRLNICNQKQSYHQNYPFEVMAHSVGIRWFQKAASKVAAVEVAVVVDDGVAAVEVVEDDYEVIMILVV